MSTTASPLLSICIPTFNRDEFLAQMLESLASALSGVPEETYELVISDNASTDSTQNVIGSFSKKVRVNHYRHASNLGGMRNLLSLPSLAKGKYIWLLGDDDLVAKSAITNILTVLGDPHPPRAIIVNHAIADESERADVKLRIAAGQPLGLNRTLISTEFPFDSLSAFEDVYRYTDRRAALNFLANVVFLRSAWLTRSQPYVEHCEIREPISDAITCGAHLCIWMECFAGRSVKVIREPIVIAFVGQQSFLAKWDVMFMVFFLDVSHWMLRAGADPECVRLYQRGIYGHSALISKLACAQDSYARKYFSLSRLIKGYGEDPELWRSFARAVSSTRGAKTRVCITFRVTLGIALNPPSWLTVLSMLGKRVVFEARRQLARAGRRSL
jgi:glycosyltransferase involved in cell wall biosynthesis